MLRFIPVYTGNITDDADGLRHCAVYPCVYREHDIDFNIRVSDYGLSLCIQGTYSVITMNDLCLRFIPVYTGNIENAVFASSYNAVYPCVYREHYQSVTSSIRFVGLSLCIQGTFESIS